MRSPSDSCLVSRVLQASYGNILVAIMPKTHTAPLAGSIVGVQPGLTDVSGLCHLYHCALFITTQASSSQLPSIASQRLLLEFLPCHALPDLRSSLKHRTKKIHKQFTLYLSCFQRQYHIDDTAKTSYQFGMYSEHLELNYHSFFRSPNLLCIFSLIIGTLYGLALFLKAPLSPFQGRVEGFSFNDHNLLAITASILFLCYELTVTT